MNQLRLFCLPYAGATAVVYHVWKAHMQNWIELYPVELAGRGHRRMAPLYQNFDEAVSDLFEQIRDRVDDKPYAIFGHSMGSWLAYELCQTIAAHGLPGPVHLFLSGRRAPNAPHRGPLYHALPEAELERELLSLGGTPRELFENEALRSLFLGIIRADFQITEQYSYRPKGKLACPITVLNGKADPMITVRELFGWRDFTESSCSICNLDGGHFFVTQNVAAVTRVVNQTLEPYAQT